MPVRLSSFVFLPSSDVPMNERYLDYGGSGPLIHLATANGFPPEAYRPFAEQLTTHQRMVGYRSRPLWPNSQPHQISSWRDLAHDMLHDMETVAAEGPVIGMGHSLGGIMSLYAALMQPERFHALVLIDPVLLPRRMLPLLWLMRQLNQHHRAPLAEGARRRRVSFESAEAALARYRGRGIFARFTPEALAGYIEGGLRPVDNGGMTLAWPTTWESRIFSLAPIDTWDAITRVQQPLLFIRGKASDLIIDHSWAQLKHHLPHAQLVELEGGHMVPMESPAAVAAVVQQFIDATGKGNGR